jgi:tRNA-Thr(GGU) m(6)t(6)A37 methyltransferase TsaA
MPKDAYQLIPIGYVESALRDRATAPRQADEGAPPAVIRLVPEVVGAAKDIAAGDEIIVLTWLHAAQRDVLLLHPRDDYSRPLTGVFSTRSPDRPNPVGLHRVRVLSVNGPVITVDALEAIDGTPVIDIKPVLGGPSER